MTDKFEPSAEMIERTAEAQYEYQRATNPAFEVVPWAEQMERFKRLWCDSARAALAIVIPMIAAECAKVAVAHIGSAAKDRQKKSKPFGGWGDEVFSKERGEDIAAEMIAMKIRSKFAAPGEKEE